MMISLALRTLRHRVAAFAGAFFALLCAAALVCACLMLLETGLRGDVVPERYAGAPAVVAADQFVRQTVVKGDGDTKTKAKALGERAWLPESVVAGLRRDGLKVVTEVTFPFGGFTGHGWESAALTPFTIAKGRAPRADDEVAVDARAGLDVGAELRGYRVVGVTAQALPSQDTVFFSTARARSLAGHPGRVSAAGVFPGLDRAPEGAVLYTGDERGRLEFLDAEQARLKLISMGGSLAGTSLLVAILVVMGTFALSIQQRQRELALLRAIAATPKQVRGLVGGEALLVAAAAGTLGAAVGIGLGFWLRGQFVTLGAVPANLHLVVSPFPPLVALAATVGAAWVAARVSARRLTRIRPVEALGEAALGPARLPWWRLVAGLVALAGGVTLTLVLSGLHIEAAATPVTLLTALVWTTAFTLLGPVVARVVAALLAVPLRISRVGGFLAARNLRAGSGTLASVMSPLTLMVAMTCTILFVQTTMGYAAQEQADAGTRADYVVAGASGAAARAVPGVLSATEVLRTSVRVGLDKYAAQAVARPSGTLDLGVVAGSMDAFGDGTAAISRTAADRLGLRPGDPLKLTLGDGTPAALTVAAVYSRGLAFGDVTLPYALVTGHVDNPSATLLVRAPGVRAATLTAALPGASVLDRATAAEVSAANPQVTFVALGLIIAFTAIAVVNTLAMATSARSGELAALRLAGTTRRQVLRMLRLETLGAVLAASVLGSVVALVTLAAFGAGMTGSAVPHVPLWTFAGVIAAAAVLSLAATALPARLALRSAA
ncbi:FtsX-like permease family protein [Nonomuraea spiralis]|uniref:FtsX-like permease family protein n=1 Tax=Nonomuraea spiralis TaxID=46182 RepID=A0ABV5II80_9ACTN|nr:ABC transporter permease [Nonomuraea spiralis]